MNSDPIYSHLKERGLKLTPSRKAIIDEVKSMAGHFDPDELMIRLREKKIKASRASVYRTLPLLRDCGLIEEAIYKDRKTCYERCQAEAHHDHMVCASCGKVIEFFSRDIERLQDEICQLHGFRSQSHTLEIRGLCSSCRPTANEKGLAALRKDRNGHARSRR